MGERGDIFRMCPGLTPIQDWVKLAVTRARAAGVPASILIAQMQLEHWKQL
ncbi:NADP-dependent isocitrate dehydrogenase [Vibrio lentus]|nr:NADP-dependent isocitrate dehydrogenase [Vibrio lentus]